jgi:hypothetical protein
MTGNSDIKPQALLEVREVIAEAIKHTKGCLLINSGNCLLKY